MITLTNLQVTFSPNSPLQTIALNDLSLHIPPGQFLTVIGSNGAGKSTLLNVLSGEQAIDSSSSGSSRDRGRILIDNQDITTWTVPQRASLIARIFQNPLRGSCGDLTIEQNLALALKRGQPRALKPALTPELRHQFRDRLAQLGLGLEGRLGDPMGLLSGGQRQALCLVMATLAPQKILLLDEHTAALDPKTAAFILELTQELVAQAGLTTLMVTHSLKQALDCGDRILMLHQGQIVLDASGAERQGLGVADLLDRFHCLDN
jgi:putative tryptophan/tyrosine transport system ATP-binding protein